MILGACKLPDSTDPDGTRIHHFRNHISPVLAARSG